MVSGGNLFGSGSKDSGMEWEAFIAVLVFEETFIHTCEHQESNIRIALSQTKKGR